MDPADHSSRREKRARYNSPPDQPADGIGSRRSSTRDEPEAPDDMETTVVYTGPGSGSGNETTVKSVESENAPENGVNA